MRQYTSSIVIIISVTIILLLSLSFSNHKDEPVLQKNHNPNYHIKAIPMPENIIFATEKVPVESFDVKESLDKELLINTYWQSQTLLFIKKAYRYFPIIDSILKEENVPTDFKYLAVAESGLANVVSPSRAAGFWQFLKGTAQDYNLEVNAEIDERYHLEKATRAAAQFLKDSYEKYGSWTMAAASYNTGRRSISRVINAQKSNNYFDLVLNEETGRYVYRLIAIKLILENPEKYGFHVSDTEKYQHIPYKLVPIDSAINHWADFAHNQSINYKTLKALNPWLRDNKLTNSSKKTYYIKIANPGYRTILPNIEFYPEDSLLIK